MKNKSVWLVFAAFIASIILGICLQGNLDFAKCFEPLGTIYVNLIKLVMGPLVLSSLVMSITSISDVKSLGKIGIKTVLYFLGTTAVAVCLGIVLSSLVRPGKGISLSAETFEAKEMPSFAEFFVGVFPDNLLKAFTDFNMLQVIVISLIIGTAIVTNYEKTATVRRLFEEIFEISSCVTSWIMKLTPLGVLGLMIPTIAKNGLSVLLPLGKLILVLYIGVVIQIVLVYGLLIKTGTKFSINQFAKALLPAQLVAFVSCSSMVALPISIKQIQEKLGVSKEVSGLVLPLGATINMDGNALYQGIVALFIAEAYGIQMTLSMKIIVVVVGTVASIGAAGVPGAGMIVLSTVLASVGLPIDGIALVAAVDRILDMGRTLVNVTGDAVVACVVDGK